MGERDWLGEAWQIVQEILPDCGPHRVCEALPVCGCSEAIAAALRGADRGARQACAEMAIDESETWKGRIDVFRGDLEPRSNYCTAIGGKAACDDIARRIRATMADKEE